MATIRKYSNRKFWYAVYRDAAGGQHTLSTGIQHSPEEKDPQERKEAEANNRRAAIIHANYLEETERGNPTEAHLRKVLSDMSERIRKKRLDFPSTEKFIRGWLESKRVSDSTKLRYKKSIESFLDSLGSKKNLPIETITPEDINQYLSARLGEGLSASTVATDHKVLNGPFNSALRQGIIISNPITAADPIESSQEARHPFAEGEIERLLEAAKGSDWEVAIHLAAFAGMRLGDAVNLQWKNVNMFDGTIAFRPKKTSRKKVDLMLPICPRLEEFIKSRAIPENKQAFLCPELAGKTSAGKSGLSMQFSAIMSKASIEQDPIVSEGKKSRTFRRKTFHSLRHYFITQLEALGVAPDLRMKLAGHSSQRVHANYSHTEIETLRKAVAGL